MIEWYNISDLEQIEKDEINFNASLPENFQEYMLFPIMESIVKFIIQEIKIKPEIKKNNEMVHKWAVYYDERIRDVLNDSEASVAVFEEVLSGMNKSIKEMKTINYLSNSVLNKICKISYLYNKGELINNLSDIFYMGLMYETLSQYCEESRRNSKAGKARGKKYEDTKQKVFERAQNLLDESKTKYTANALADKITNAYLLGNMPGVRFDAENPKNTIYRWLKNEFSLFQNNEKKI